eukprot:6194126-Pleurochrysis_carterae.AAC.2
MSAEEFRRYVSELRGKTAQVHPRCRADDRLSMKMAGDEMKLRRLFCMRTWTRVLECRRTRARRSPNARTHARTHARAHTHTCLFGRAHEHTTTESTSTLEGVPAP